MSPPPPPAPSPDNPESYREAIEDFKRGGWVVSLLGGAGMLARMLLTDESHPAIYWFRRVLAGSIVGVLAYFALYKTEMNGVYKSIILSTSGALSPELLEYLINKLKPNNGKKAKKRRRSR
jgi:uncharacterized membrane protein YeaQ/YmgE (transglycosylase-associated protein family)